MELVKEMPKIISEFNILCKLSKDFKQNIKIFYIFKKPSLNSDTNNIKWSGFNVLISTKDHKVYAFGQNSLGQLGLGHVEPVDQPTIIPELIGKQIVDFANGVRHCVARSIEGEVYDWGRNDSGNLGIGVKNKLLHKPELVRKLIDKNVTQICCGSYHTLALTKCGEVYAWGSNECGQLGMWSVGSTNKHKPTKVFRFSGNKIVKISCGFWHSIALSEKGRVYSWGLNRVGQLGIGNKKYSQKPALLKILNKDGKEVLFHKISCGPEHSLLLSRDLVLYAFGKNNFGQLGRTGHNQLRPIEINSETKYVDIASHNFLISTALSLDGYYHVWGNYEGNKIPIETKSHIEIFNGYGITYRTIDPEIYDSIPKRINGKCEEDFTNEILIYGSSFGVVFEAMNKNDSKIYKIIKIPFSLDNLELVHKELKFMKSLKGGYVVKYITEWIENNYYLKSEYRNKIIEKVNSQHEIFKIDYPILLHIQTEYYICTLSKLIDQMETQKYIDARTFYMLHQLSIQLVESVNYLHKMDPQIIHGDLKPDNILLTDGTDAADGTKGRIKIKIGPPVEQSHISNQGDTKYMPHGAGPGIRDDNTKNDIYSLALVFGELFGFDKEL